MKTLTSFWKQMPLYGMALVLGTGCNGGAKKGGDSSDSTARTSINGAWRMENCDDSDGATAREISFNTSAGTFSSSLKMYADQATCEAGGTAAITLAQAGTYALGAEVSNPTGNEVVFTATTITGYAVSGAESNLDSFCTPAIPSFPADTTVSFLNRDCSTGDLGAVTGASETFYNVVQFVAGTTPVIKMRTDFGAGPFVGGSGSVSSVQGQEWVEHETFSAN